MISSLKARRISSDWHNGGGSALYAFTSSGTINCARHGHDILAEIDENIRGTKATSACGLMTVDEASTSLRELLELRSYIVYYSDPNTQRPAMRGWANLTW